MVNPADPLMQTALTEYWEHTTDMAFIKDVHGVYLCASKPFAEMVGLADAGAVAGKTDFEIFSDQKLARRYVEDDAQLLESGVPLEKYIEPIAGKNGRPRYAVTSKRVLRDGQGNPIGIFGVGRDITVEYEAKLNYESELKNLFELPQDALAAVLFDITNWRVVDMRYREESNRVVSRYGRIDAYFQNVVEQIVDNEQARAFFRGLTQQSLLKAYGSGKRRESVEYIRRMSDGAERWVRDELYFLLDPVNGNLSLSIVLHDIDASKRAYTELLHAAEQDAMTGLLNHDGTIRRIERYLAGASGMQALLMIDLDNFKLINDNFGHQYGDGILSDAADAIRGVFRTSDIIGRIGGDEFMVLMKNVRSEETVRQKIEALIVALQFSAQRDDQLLELTTSVGCTLFAAGTRGFSALYDEADAALYQAKKNGKDQYCIYDSDLGAGQHGVLTPVFDNVNTVQLRTLFEYMDGGVILAEVRDDIRITYVSPSFYLSFSGEREDDDDREYNDILTHVLPEDLPGLREMIFDAARTGALTEYLYRVSLHGEQEWRRLRIKRIPERGDGVHRLIAVVTDVTKIQRTNEQLHEAEVRYRTAVEQTEAMLWEMDLVSRTLTLTGSAWERYEGAAAAFPGAPESFLQTGMICGDSADALRRMFAKMDDGAEDGGCYLKIADKNGAELFVKAQFRLLYRADGAPYRALGLMQPVPNINAEMRRFEQELRFYDLVHESLLGHFRINLSKNQLEYAVVPTDSRYDAVTPGLSYDEFHRFVGASFVDAEDFAQFERLTQRAFLQERFHEGETWRFMDYRRIDAGGERRWRNLFIKLMRHPVSGDLYAFAYLRDNDVRHRWQLALNLPVQRSAALQLYSQEYMEQLARHVLSSCPAERMVAVSVIGLLGPERVREEMGAAEESELLFTFGRLCRIVIGGDAAVGQLDETRVVLLRTDAVNTECQRQRVTGTMHLLQDLLEQAHPGVNVGLIGGFAVERAGETSYDLLLRKATVACQSAMQTLGELAVAYADPGIDAADGTDAVIPADLEELKQRYRALELRYQQQATLLRISENDELTGIFGKPAFYRRVREVLSTAANTRYALVRFDINRFKVFNDMHGIAAGDKLLRDIGAGMRRHIGTAAAYGRLVSDHFVLLVKDDEPAIRRSAGRLAGWLSERAPNFRMTCTVGVYPVSDPSVDVSLMCDRALLALRSAKNGAETRVAYYDEKLRDQMLEEQRLMNDVQSALQTRQFVLYFQPQINYVDGALVGAEALVRWNHPERGLLPPGEFIPLFERNGLITSLDQYVWDECCRWICQWREQYPQMRTLPVSVNVSRLDIYDPKLCRTLRAIVEKYGLPASALNLEITESAYMENPQQLVDTVLELQKAGFVVEMDDFGSGFSSLNTLKDVSVDVLKLDMKFLADCADRARGGNILSSVIRMAHWLKLPVIAEGVETRDQAEYLKSLSCVNMQGYYFSKPLPAERFERMLAERGSGGIDGFADVDLEGIAAFWDASAQTTLLFNSFVGGAAILEYQSGTAEIVRANDRFYAELGTTREAFLDLQRHMNQCFDEKNAAVYTAMLEQAVRSGDEAECELKWLSLGAGGSALYTYNRIRPLAQNGGVHVLYLAVENITVRKVLEMEREVETERSRLLMQTTGTAFFDYDYGTDTVSYQIFLPGRGVVKRKIPDCGTRSFESVRLHPESVAALRRVIEDGRNAHVSGNIEFLADFSGGGMRWYRMRYASVANESGRIYRIVGQGSDIQEQKDRAALSEAIGERLNAKGYGQAYDDVIVNQIYSLFYESADILGAIETTLALLGEYYGLSRAYIFEDDDGHSAASNTFEWCAPGIAPQRELLQGVPYARMGGRERFVANFDLSGTHYCRDIQECTPEERALLEPQGIVSMLLYAIRDNGVFTGFVGYDECKEGRVWREEQVGTLMFVSRIIGSFLSRLRQFDRERFVAALAAAEEANAVKSELLSKISDDLRAPLNAVVGLTSIAREHAALPPEVDEYLSVIDSSGRVLQGMMNDILDMAKVERRIVEFYPERYEYGEFINTIRAAFGPLCERKGVRLVIEEHPPKETVLVDRVRFNQIFFNVLSNAVQFTPEGGTVCFTQRGGEMHDGVLPYTFEVSDTGCGMSEAVVAHAFEPFADERRGADAAEAGSGLGLPIAKRIVDLMGGAMDITSVPGVGTRVRIDLDLPVDAGGGAPMGEAQWPQRLEGRLAGKRVLLAEDALVDTVILKGFLERAGAEAVCTKNGRAAVDAFAGSAAGYFDAILMDLFMPVMDGLTAARNIRALARADAKTVPIIALSANALMEDRALSHEAGMDAHLPKPLDLQQLLETLLGLTERRAG